MTLSNRRLAVVLTGVVLVSVLFSTVITSQFLIGPQKPKAEPSPSPENTTPSSSPESTSPSPQSTNQTAPSVLLAGSPSPFTVEQTGDNYTATDSHGKIAYSNPNASEVVNYAVANGKSVMLKGKIVLNGSIVVENSSVTISGENIAGDLFFTNDENYSGFFNKWGTTIVAENITAFEVGKTNFVFGITIQNLGITGFNSDSTIDIKDENYTDGAGIRAYKVDTFQVSNVQITRKDVAINMTPKGDNTKNNVIDYVTFDNIVMNYNRYGICLELLELLHNLRWQKAED
jgi:hypothetical protein